ncbi:MAG: glycine dehydrogenase (aminomethyl-transferring), partial [Flavobacteriales bacterium]|nr:glycine dehydrogenase (aminomethyl-transferring) [Flavobacteriales bacterium]
MPSVTYQERHIGPNASETAAMLKAIGVSSLDELIDRTVPKGIRRGTKLDVGPAMTEREHLDNMRALGAKNKVFRSYIGLGYSGTILPPPIQRNIFENPGWYTAYTPYQAEISQGRLEALLNFQTMCSDLTGLPIANASLLDEATAIAEAMHMLYAAKPKELADANKFFADKGLYPQNIDVLRTRCAPIGVELVVGDVKALDPADGYFGIALQYPAIDGSVNDYRAVVSKAKAAGVRTAVCADLLSLVLLTPPGEWGADVVVGNTQRFGVPMGYGGPHAAYFATCDDFKRLIPGRIIGVSQDRRGKQGLRMALQTREQHIRRDKATSNICTAQALLAVMAGMYAVYHGPDGLKRIARNVHAHTRSVAEAAKAMGYTVANGSFFDTITLKEVNKVKSADANTLWRIKEAAEKHGINFRYDGNNVSIAFDETVRMSDANDVVAVLAEAIGTKAPALSNSSDTLAVPADLQRKSPFLTHPVFNTHHTELELQRYIKRLENKDFSLMHGMIPLGSCTMKLNAASTLLPLSWPEWANIHPFVPVDQTEGYQELLAQL